MQRFLAKIRIDPETGCWMWTAHINKVTGYGEFWDGTRLRGAHAFSYEAHKGPLPKGLEPDHLCRRRPCVNPAHLEAVTRLENLLRGDTNVALGRTRTHCAKGHPLDGDNVYLTPRGWRRCRKCRRKEYQDWVSQNREQRRELDRNHLTRQKLRKQEMEG
jgi:hypothetical protein